MTRPKQFESYDPIQFKQIEFYSPFRIYFNYLALMFFPSPSTWKKAKDDPDHIPENIIGLDQTSHKIVEDNIS